MLRPQDILILLALGRDPSTDWTYGTLSGRIGVSKSETHRALQRAAASHLFDADSRQIRKAELLEFITHGVRYAFAVTPAETRRGVPTCWRAPGLEEHLVENELEQFVWPHPHGTHRGRAIEPLHDAAFMVTAQDEVLHRWLALCDAIRLGGARERKLAASLLQQELRGTG